MNLSETVDLMNSSDYKERFRAEYLQLKIRIEGLDKMLIQYVEGTLPFTPTCSYWLLHSQLEAMITYACLLEDRADIEGIEL